MTTTEHAPAEVLGTSLDLDRRESQCMVCEHELDSHDLTGRRYCEATQANALARNCICRVG